MAKPIELLEDSARVLRDTPLATWLWHWAGSVPLALAVLVFWRTAVNPRSPDAVSAMAALLLALLLTWMNVCRSVFASRIRAQLAGTIAPRPRLWRVAASQSLLAATKLIALPVSLLVLFPLPQTVAFYRYAAALSAADEPDPRACIRKAARLAAIPDQEWIVFLLLLVLLHMVLLLNLAIVIGIAPHLVRILTGHESSFSRSGIYFVANPLFFLLVFAVAWIAFDPFAQTVYTLRAFRLESFQTGEDLRAELRQTLQRGADDRISSSAGSIPVLFAVIPPEQLRESIRQAMQQHQYDWRLPPPATGAASHSWLVNLTDRFVALLRQGLHALGGALDRFFRWLRGSILTSSGGTAPHRGLHWSIYVLIGAVLLLAIAIVWRRSRRRARPAAAGLQPLTPVQLDAEDLAPDRLPEESWLELGARCLGEGNLRFALRAFYLANLAWLGRREFISIHPGKTNREYERELRRRARAAPRTPDLFAANVAIFERAWYGMHDVSSDDVAQFRARIDQMKGAPA